MNYNQTSFVRQLIPKSFNFCAYDSINYPNSKEKNLFSDNVIPMGTHYLITKLVSPDLLKIEFSSICPKSEIQILPYYLNITDYISKLITAQKKNSDFISLNIQIRTCCNRRIHKCKFESTNCIALKKNHNKISEAKIYFDITEIKKSLKTLEE